jgi:hypothetical protein
MSHLIPNFVIAWMKELSLTGNLVQASTPNMSKQQGKREHLLCNVCEQRFGVWENLVAKRVFKPFQAGRREPFAYGDWLLRYAVSQSWRTALDVCGGLFRLEEPAAVGFVDDAIASWRNYLLGNQTDSGPYEHHLWFFDVVVEGRPPATTDYRYEYLKGGVDATLLCHGTTVRVYTKLPGMVLWSTIHPSATVGWKDTLIGTGGTIGPNQAISDNEFLEFFASRVE